MRVPCLLGGNMCKRRIFRLRENSALFRGESFSSDAYEGYRSAYWPSCVYHIKRGRRYFLCESGQDLKYWKKCPLYADISACQKSHILLRGRPLVQGVPSPKTVHRTVFEFTPCGAFSGYMWGFAPHPTRAVSPWPDQRDVIPLETRCLSFRLDSNIFVY